MSDHIKNPIVVPTVLHIIIPCILLGTKTYEISFLFFIIIFSLSFLRAVITISFLCKQLNKRLTYIVLFLDFVITGIYLVFSIISRDPLIYLFTLIYMMGFIWVVQETKTYLKNFTSLSQHEEKIIVVVDDGVECCICYEGVVEGKMLNCGHIYHKECIDSWFNEKKICPYCRASPDDL